MNGSLFSVHLGNLKSNTRAVVRLGYLRRLDSAGATLEYAHTATWVPPYFTAREIATDGRQKVCLSLIQVPSNSVCIAISLVIIP